MNPLARGVHKNLNSRKAAHYSRMANDRDVTEESSPQQGRLRLGRRLKGGKDANASSSGGMKLAPSAKDSKTKGEKHNQHSTSSSSQQQQQQHQQQHQQQEPEYQQQQHVQQQQQQQHVQQHLPWANEFPSQFPTEFSIMQRRHQSPREQQPHHHHSSSPLDDSELSVEASAVTNGESVDAAVGPTITKPAPQHHHHNNHNHHNHQQHNSLMAAPLPGPTGLPGGNTVCSSATFESHDQVEKPSITSPSIHQWTAARNRMGGARKMLSEKTINTINTIDTRGTINTSTTTGTGTHTATTADSTMRSSIVSLGTAASLNASLMDLVPDSPAGRMVGMGSGNMSALMREQEEQEHMRLRMRQDGSGGGVDNNMSITDLGAVASPRPYQMTENDEDRMMRLAMEMSLREFEEEQQEHRTPNALNDYHNHQSMPSSQRYPSDQHSSKMSATYSSSSSQLQSSSQLPMDSLLMQRPPSSPTKDELQVRDRLTEYYRQSSQHSLLTSATGEEATEVLVENPHFAMRQRRTQDNNNAPESSRSSSNSPVPTTTATTTTTAATNNPSMVRQLESARAHLSKEEADEIEFALRESGDVILPRSSNHSHHHQMPPRSVSLYNESASAATPAAGSSSLVAMTAAQHLSSTEAEEIQRAIREADEQENQRSINVALQLQAEESVQYSNSGATTRRPPDTTTSDPFMVGTQQMTDDYNFPTGGFTANFDDGWDSRFANTDEHDRMNANFELHQQQQNEAEFDFDADEDLAFVGNTAYNAFKMSRQNSKGSSYRSNGSSSHDNNKSPVVDKDNAIDRRVQLQITRAVNSGLIEKCNGIVKEGSEAVVYHADKGENSQGHDVAIKVFKRIKEFRGRGDYQEGDPRYMGLSFRDNGSQEQLELWAEKEYRNVIRANRARVPVASPLMHKDNIVFMRFMGKDGWPSPQLKEVEERSGSRTWTLLYSQIMVAVRRLYVTARLVHGDLSEYNILVCPAELVENKDEVSGSATDGNPIQAVLIDFGQAVDVHHPKAKELLIHDLAQIRKFFSKKGTKTLGSKMAMEFVTKPEPAEASSAASAAAEESKQPGRMVSTANSFSTKSSRSAGSSEKGGETLKRRGNMVSVNSSSSRSSGPSSSSAGSEDASDPPSRLPSINSSASTNVSSIQSAEQLKEAIAAKEKKKKEKKAKKEKKEKKKSKKDVTGKKKSSSKAVDPITQTPQSVNEDAQLFPVITNPEALPDGMFGSLGDLDRDVDWATGWNEEIHVNNRSPSDPS